MLCNTPDSGALEERAAAKSLTELKDLVSIAAQQQAVLESVEKEKSSNQDVCTDSVCYSTWKPKREI